MSSGLDATFHPIVARWFAERVGHPTAPQRRGWESIRSGANTLIAAPTGSGKTLAAFLIAIDELVKEGTKQPLPDETRVVYVSPLKALSADIHKNLAEPRREIRALAEAAGVPAPRITAAVRTGDTPMAERAAMVRKPPHILVTTPESLYILLTAERSREMLRSVRTVIVDEIHAVIESRRGAHLSLSLERLSHVARAPLQRIGLSATQRPIEQVGRFLTGGARPNARPLTIVDEGHRRALDLALEIPSSPLEAVMAHEVWSENYDRLAALIREHRTTIVFVNTRRLAERASRHLAERLGSEVVTAHHGSLSKELRLDAEERLKEGKLKALVATASLELGIDIGHVDLVCQLGSPNRIATFLQRVGRSGHTVSGTPKGRLFPLSRDDLLECTALLDAVRRGELDRIVTLEQPIDVLAQQVAAEAAAEDWALAQLFELVTRAEPYRALTRGAFDDVVDMLASGYTTRRGRRGALLHLDSINGRVRGRRGTRLLAITSGGAIPENADYRVMLDPEGLLVGTVNEDFAIESTVGDVFQLGNASWRITKVERGTVRVADAKGHPPNLPFWLGEAPSRSRELSTAVAELRHKIDIELEQPDGLASRLESALTLPSGAATQLVTYLGDAKRMLGALPDEQTLLVERFFDESGGMQLILHSPFGAKVNRAWGLALRKRFCRSFNFELQAAATEDAVLLSLGPQHSFPLETVFKFLHPDTVEEILIQAFLDAPMFGTRWRWNANISLAVPRFRGGKKVPPQIQRMEADDLLAAVFPDAAACLENIAGDREIPSHPLARQAIHDCLHDAMDIDGLIAVLHGIHDGKIRCIARDLPEPSPLAAEILNAAPFAFLDDAPLEERRTQAVYSRRAFEFSNADQLGALDQAAIERVKEEAWPEVRSADELHDALLTSGFITEAEGQEWTNWFGELEQTGRARAARGLWVAAERMALVEQVFSLMPTADEAAVELLRGRLEILGPITAERLGAPLGLSVAASDQALAMLESQGVVLRGRFTPGQGPNAPLEWCDRRLLARIHRYTLNRLRAEIEPVSAADFIRFLSAWQHVAPEQRMAGLEGLAGLIEQLEGFSAAAAAWEPDVLSSRCLEYDPSLLDALCLSGRVAWARLSSPSKPADDAVPRAAARPVRSSPIALFPRANLDRWLDSSDPGSPSDASSNARTVLEYLERRGACFFAELVTGTRLLTTQVEQALGELVSLGMVHSDGFVGIRALITPSNRRKPLHGYPRRQRTVTFGIEAAGRWSRIRGAPTERSVSEVAGEIAQVLLKRYGIVFRRLLERESLPVQWRDLVPALRRLEARGEIRGGRFVLGMAGEHFALPDAVVKLRAIRRGGADGELVSVSGADPLNLIGILTPGERVPALASNRIVYLNGVPAATVVAGETRYLLDDTTERSAITHALGRPALSPAIRSYLGLPRSANPLRRRSKVISSSTNPAS